MALLDDFLTMFLLGGGLSLGALVVSSVADALQRMTPEERVEFIEAWKVKVAFASEDDAKIVACLNDESVGLRLKQDAWILLPAARQKRIFETGLIQFGTSMLLPMNWVRRRRLKQVWSVTGEKVQRRRFEQKLLLESKRANLLSGKTEPVSVEPLEVEPLGKPTESLPDKPGYKESKASRYAELKAIMIDLIGKKKAKHSGFFRVTFTAKERRAIQKKHFPLWQLSYFNKAWRKISEDEDIKDLRGLSKKPPKNLFVNTSL